MTSQIRENLFYKGEEKSMASEPLNDYLRNRIDIKFIKHSSACWRGYYGEWEITDNKLYLIGLVAYIEEYKEVDLNYLFPGQNKVFADWYSGEICIPQGKMVKYVHLGYHSEFEKYLILKFDKGVLSEEKLIDHKELIDYDEDLEYLDCE